MESQPAGHAQCVNVTRGPQGHQYQRDLTLRALQYQRDLTLRALEYLYIKHIEVLSQLRPKGEMFFLYKPRDLMCFSKFEIIINLLDSSFPFI